MLLLLSIIILFDLSHKGVRILRIVGNELVVQAKRISTTSAMFLEVNGQYVLENSEQKTLVNKPFNLTYKKWGLMSVQ